MAKKNTYTVDLICDKIDHTVHHNTEAKDFQEAIQLALKEWEPLNPKATAVRLVENPTAEYYDQEETVTLTRDAWHWLTTYLLMTTKYREGERDAWKNLSKELYEDGKPKYTKAASNAKFWSDMIEKIDAIRKAIDNA